MPPAAEMCPFNKPAESRLPVFRHLGMSRADYASCLTTMYRYDGSATSRKCRSICSASCSHWNSRLLQINRKGRVIGFLDLRKDLAVFWLFLLCGCCKCKVYLALHPFDPGAQSN